LAYADGDGRAATTDEASSVAEATTDEAAETTAEVALPAALDAGPTGADGADDAAEGAEGTGAGPAAVEASVERAARAVVNNCERAALTSAAGLAQALVKILAVTSAGTVSFW